jgi:hypothetical protein
MNNSDELYKTTDMSLATILSMQYPVRELQNKNGKGTFYFDNSDELQEYVNNFWNRQLQVEPNALFDALKIIKNRLYNEVK